jgi:hypothetical protein
MEGKHSRLASMPRYVILQHLMPPHSGRGSHYDLMLQVHDKLFTWALPDLPRADLQTTATRLPDHRLAYLDYEGPISGGRGEVRRVDSGNYKPREWTESLVICELQGVSSSLICELACTSGQEWTAEFCLAE